MARKKPRSSDPTVQKPWWEHDDDRAAAAKAYSDATGLQSDQEWRRHRALLSVRPYQSRGFQPGVVTGDLTSDLLGPDTRSNVNARLLGSAVDTLKAEVAGRVKPTVKFLTKGADWKTKRKAEGLSDFIDATFRAPQGDYQNTWCLGVELFQDMLTFSEGWVEISSQLVDEKTSTYEITHSRQFPWEMFVDENEARYGRPRNLYRVTEMSVDDALSRFVDNAEGIDKEEAQRRRAAII